MTIKRREFLAASAATAGLAGFGIRPAFAQAAEPSYKPEEGASLRLLRWTPFVKGDEDAWLANTKKFTDATGVQVRIDKESWEDIRPWPPRSAPVRTWSCAGSTTRTSIPTSCST